VRPPEERDTRPSEEGGALFDALLPETARQMVRGSKRLYVIPHGSLFALPFETLPGWMQTLPPTVYVYSGSVLKWCRSRRREQGGQSTKYSALVIADPQSAGRQFAELPGTRREAAEIVRAITGTHSLLGEDATLDRLRPLAPQARYLHFATHQADAGLVLTGAPLRLEQLFREWRDRLSACELVVLSACESGTGPLQKDEGPYAMPLGFLYAGVPAVIASLWRVNDDSTAELFADFYIRLAKGTPKLQAFTEARLELKKKYPDPYHWGAFIYIGDPR